MSNHLNAFHVLHVIDRDLSFFTPDEQHQLYHLSLLQHKEQRQLGKLIKEAHQYIQKILISQQPQLQTACTTLLDEQARVTVAQQQHYALSGFLQHKRTKQLYLKLKIIKDRYHEMMLQQQIRRLENDMERYQKLQAIHGLSGRLDASSQVYDELHYLRLAILSLHRQWKLDRIQQMVNTLATTSHPSEHNLAHSQTSSLPSPDLLPPTFSSLPSSISNHHNHRWYLLSRKSRKSTSALSESSGFLGTVKKWLKHPSLTGNTNRANKGTETTAAVGSGSAKETIAGITHGHHHQFRQGQSHSHLLCANQEECQIKIHQIIRDFHDVFKENARQNGQRMHEMYTRAFEPEVDPMLAEDIQRLCQSITDATPPSLVSLTQPGVSSAFSWNFGLPDDTIRCSFDVNTESNTIDSLQAPSLSSLILPPTSTPIDTKLPSVKKNQGKSGIKWMWHKKVSKTTNKRQKDPMKTSLLQQQWSVCLGLLSEHLLHVGQQYYTRWLEEFTKAQQQQTAPFQVATETLASMYKALQIEQGHAVLSNLCTHLEPSTL